ncbi:hypothetical protein AB0F91_01010 [Amycolatopsis sp. NPDC023774]|uniref:hypothetical protein n=1 Tax=Amycolatopsis sp. NPDC023774 TaxID=3155015 RepID=UPI003406856B
MSQIKINTTNAYSGSLSFANFFSRVLHKHPGRAWYVLVNCGIALALMEFGAFAFLNKILGSTRTSPSRGSAPGARTW